MVAPVKQFFRDECPPWHGGRCLWGQALDLMELMQQQMFVCLQHHARMAPTMGMLLSFAVDDGPVALGFRYCVLCPYPAYKYMVRGCRA
jgi:hypothetical protein